MRVSRAKANIKLTMRQSATQNYASNMTYQLILDASLVLQSLAGGSMERFFFCLLVGEEKAIHGPIACSSKMVCCLVALVAKAEIAAMFQSVQLTLQDRKILHEFG